MKVLTDTLNVAKENNLTDTTISHPELVRRLAKPGADILTTLDAGKANMWHAATGIAGEASELLGGVYTFMYVGGSVPSQRENIIEECGDLYFYIEQLCQATRIELDYDAYLSTYGAHSLRASAFVAIEAGNVLDLVKKHVVYNKPLDVELLGAHLYKLAMYIAAICERFGTTRAETIDYNIKKLSKRYGDGVYTDKAAQVRADKEEGQ